MRKAYFRYVGWLVVILAVVVVMLPSAQAPHHENLVIAALLFVVGVLSVRKANTLNHDHKNN